MGRRNKNLLCLLLLLNLSPAWAVTRDEAIAKAREAGEPALTEAYERWSAKIKKLAKEKWKPPQRTEPWLREEPLSAVQDSKSAEWTIVWKDEPPAGWTIHTRIRVNKNGEAKIQRAQATHASQ